MRTVLPAAALAAGLGLLIVMVVHVGPLRLWGEMVRGGPALAWVLPVSLAWFVCNTWGWRLAMEAPAPALPLFRVHVAAEAVNNLTPFMALGGEPLKFTLLRRWIKTDAVIASVIGDNVVHVLSAPVFMGAGLFLGASVLDLQHALFTRIMAATGLIGLVALTLWLALRCGLVGALARGVGRRLEMRCPGWVEVAGRVDRGTRRFLEGRSRRFWASFGLHLAGRLLGAVEAWLIMAVIGVPLSLAAAIFLISIAHVGVNLAFSFIPSQLGVQEAAACIVFSAIGLDPASALTLMLLRRARSLIWIGIGLVLLLSTRGNPE